jgi:hypothetical protein
VQRDEEDHEADRRHQTSESRQQKADINNRQQTGTADSRK